MPSPEGSSGGRTETTVTPGASRRQSVSSPPLHVTGEEQAFSNPWALPRVAEEASETTPLLCVSIPTSLGAGLSCVGDIEQIPRLGIL